MKGTMKPELLKRIGEALYGQRWMRPLSRDLGVNHRSVERWARGTYKIHTDYVVKLRALLEKSRKVHDKILDLKAMEV